MKLQFAPQCHPHSHLPFSFQSLSRPHCTAEHCNHYPNYNQLVQLLAAFGIDIRNELFATVAGMVEFDDGFEIDAIVRVDLGFVDAGFVALVEVVVDIVLFEIVKRIAANDSLHLGIAYALAALLALYDFDDTVAAPVVMDIETVAIHKFHLDHSWVASEIVLL